MALRIAIVGRPNVGKSTLFNRLAGRKLAIVDDRPGVTRDRRFASGRLGDLDLELIDTAGFEDVSDESLEARMRIQTELAIDEADAVVFVFDAREGVTALDQVFAELLRRRDKPVVLAANKAEGRAGDSGTTEGYSLGLGEPIPISAEHGEGLADLYAALEAFDAAARAGVDEAEDADEADKPIRIAIIGRPNAGKSTLINRLIGEERLLTGPEAGITRDSISVDWEWDGRRIRLVDTAGMRRKARVQETLERLSVQDSLRAITFAEVVVLVMDADNAFEVQDLQIADLVEREGRALMFVLAKWDLVEDPKERLKELVAVAGEKLPQVRGTPVVALSARTGRGLDRLMPTLLKVYGDWSTKVKTRDLNDWLALATQRHPPPVVDGRRIKPKYVAQTKARPPTFVLFASRASQLPDSYRRYLINSIRESFDLPGVPIRLTVKSSSGANPYVDGGEGRPQRSKASVRPGAAHSRVSRKPPADKTAAAEPPAATALAAESPADTPRSAQPRSARPPTSKARTAKPPTSKPAAGKSSTGKPAAGKSRPAAKSWQAGKARPAGKSRPSGKPKTSGNRRPRS